MSSNCQRSNASSSLNVPARVSLEVEDFCNITKYGLEEFKFPPNSKIQFTLDCYGRVPGDLEKRTSFGLYLRSYQKDKIIGHKIVRHKMSIINSNGNKCEIQENGKSFINGQPLCVVYYVKHNHVELPENGKLSIYCEFEEIDFKNETLKLKPELPKNPLLTNYQALLESGKFSDVTLIIGERKLMAHKNILSTQSKVFAAMFENDCEEKRQNRVEITDVPVEVCEQMLRYIYTGNVSDIGEFAADLFIAADKYQLDHLKSVCEQHLEENLRIESVSTILLLADMHQASELKSKCIDYITDNMTKVMATDGWKGLISAKEHVQSAARLELTLELLKLIAIKTNR